MGGVARVALAYCLRDAGKGGLAPLGGPFRKTHADSPAVERHRSRHAVSDLDSGLKNRPKEMRRSGVYSVNTMEEHHLKGRTFTSTPGLHPIDRGLARRWTKQRLAAVFPDLRGDEVGLESAYRALNLEPTFGGDGGSELVFEMTSHRNL
jgi:hypothetical protein